jgi:hypothetical protein
MAKRKTRIAKRLIKIADTEYISICGKIGSLKTDRIKNRDATIGSINKIIKPKLVVFIAIQP